MKFARRERHGVPKRKYRLTLRGLIPVIRTKRKRDKYERNDRRNCNVKKMFHVVN